MGQDMAALKIMLISVFFLLEEIETPWKIFTEKFCGKYDILAVMEKVDQREEKFTSNVSKIILISMFSVLKSLKFSNGDLSKSIKILVLASWFFVFVFVLLLTGIIIY